MRTSTAGCWGILVVLTACCLSLLILEARYCILPLISKLDSPSLCAMNWFMFRESWLYRLETVELREKLAKAVFVAKLMYNLTVGAPCCNLLRNYRSCQQQLQLRRLRVHLTPEISHVSLTFSNFHSPTRASGFFIFPSLLWEPSAPTWSIVFFLCSLPPLPSYYTPSYV